MGGKTHGMSGTRLYKAWCSMMSRCYYCKNIRYEKYGGRGIQVCDDWKDPKAFMKWAVESGYTDNLTLDRIDCNKNYSPDNCRWITNKEQQQNKTNNHNIEYNGEIHCVAEWSRITGISYQTIFSRLKRGLTAKEIFETPVSDRHAKAIAKRWAVSV